MELSLAEMNEPAYEAPVRAYLDNLAGATYPYMPALPRPLFLKIREHCEATTKVTSRDKAMEWMAKADALLKEVALVQVAALTKPSKP